MEFFILISEVFIISYPDILDKENMHNLFF